MNFNCSSLLKKLLLSRYFPLLLCLLYVFATQHFVVMGRFYADIVYPFIAPALNHVSSFFPFALGDIFIFSAVIGVIVYPFYTRLRGKRSWRHIIVNESTFLLWVYVWFYMAWGLNYSQPNFYQRTNFRPVAYSDSVFLAFTDNYLENLNASYVPQISTDKDEIRRAVVCGYEQMDKDMGIRLPFRENMKEKTMVFSSLASKVAVLGSMGPFFCEFTLNEDLLPENYPFSFAHELSHVLGITSEAEANFYAYLVCTRSEVPSVKYSGYYEILSYVMKNVYFNFGEEGYKEFLAKIRPEILAEQERDRAYWRAKYSPFIGDIQNFFYDIFLKKNRVEGGMKNYSYVIGLLMSYEAEKHT